MNEVFIKILNMSITASYIIIAAVLIKILFKKAPKWINYILWGMVGIRLIFPFSIKSIFSVMPETDVIPVSVIPGHTFTDIPAVTAGQPAAITGNLTADTSTGFIDILALVWVFGIIMLLLYGLLSYINIKHRVRDAVLVGDNIYKSTNIASPFILGMIKPAIYLPYGADEQNIRHIIAHEEAHIRRRDHWIKPLGYVLLSVYWFNPLIWLGYMLMCRDIEMACDEAVIKKLGVGQKKAYSETLLSCSIHRKTIAACPLAFGEVGVKERIRNVLSYKKPTLWIIIAAVILSVVLVLVFLTNPRDRQSAEFPTGTYEFAEVIYMTPVSSYYPFDDTYEIYDINNTALSIISKETGGKTKEINYEKPIAVSYTGGEWKESFMISPDFSDIPSITADDKSMWALSDEFQVFVIKGDIWLVRFSGEHIWSIYKLKVYEETKLADEYNGLNFQEPVIEPELDEILGELIPQAINTVNSMSYTESDISSQAYTILAREDKPNEIVLYIMAMHMEFYIHDGRLLEAGGNHLPVVMTIQNDGSGVYSMNEYWEPADGAGFMESLRRKFPEGFDEELLNTQLYVKSHTQECYASAVRESGVDADARIKKLIEIICMSPADSPNPLAYVQEHEVEFRELVYYGNYTLRYCFDLFEDGGQTGLEGYIMALACREILETGPQGEALGYATGQEWYDIYSKLVSVAPVN